MFPEGNTANCLTGPWGSIHKTSSGAALKTYAASQSLPTMEDFGEAEMVNGQANVPLERSFASTIDTSRPYLVFVTPEGDCHGLYVANKTPRGFAVRELMGGRNTLAFQYRIVAHPYGDASTRLAGVSLKSRSASSHRTSHFGNPHSEQFATMIAESNAQRAAAARRFVRTARMPARPAPPVLSPGLFKP